jgi:hypothetical protein
MPDKAASSCANCAVVARVVTRCTTNNGSLDAPFADAGADTDVSANRAAIKIAETLMVFTRWMTPMCDLASMRKQSIGYRRCSKSSMLVRPDHLVSNT